MARVPAASATNGTIFSFIVDDDPTFLFAGWHLARSLIEHCGGTPSAIVVQCTPEVPEAWRIIFRDLGCQVRQIARFGDGRYCNKLNQLGSLRSFDYDRAVLLDTDMIAVSDLRVFLSDTAILGKIVDAPNPPLTALTEIAAQANMPSQPATIATDTGQGETYVGNCNGGFYSVPRAYAEKLSNTWRHWALWLLDNIEPLRRSDDAVHADQVSFWLAIHHMGLPFQLAPSNVNYFTHMQGEHRYFDGDRSLALLHYHTTHLDVLGRIVALPDSNPVAHAAIARANEQIGKGFDNRVFWELRYHQFPDRGSGVGSRGENITYKRALLIAQGVETASSVLDIGCGDIEVVKALSISNYLGVDQAVKAIEIARRARPDWQFCLAPATNLPSAEMVLCFEVLIHQKDKASYDALIRLLAEKTRGSLLVSGYAKDNALKCANPMIFFYEPIATSLERTGRFRSVQEIGRHTDVVIYRCDV
jgi:2-polyprenyl-3-methyl-5-hydroxy-6-metoxy-1,4-benzoquinol methylase